MENNTNSFPLEKLNFEPSIKEQLLLPKINDHNVLVLFTSDEVLVRLISLITLFFLKKEKSDQNSAKTLILTKRSYQNKLHTMLLKNLDKKISILNGSILPNARRFDYNNYSIIIATPKVVKNDFKDGLFSKNNFNLLIINHAEIGSSSSSLRYLVNKMENIHVCGFTQYANKERLRQVCKNLTLSELVRFDNINNKEERANIQYYSIPLPREYFFTLEILDSIRKHELEELKSYGFGITAKSTFREVTAIHKTLIEEKDLKLLVKTANLQRIMIIQKIIVSQGFAAALEYFKDIETKLKNDNNFIGKQAIQEFLNDVKIKKLKEYLLLMRDLDHPKSKMLLKLISRHKSGIAVITHNFYNATFLKSFLTNQGISVIQIEEPISSLTEIKLKQLIIHFSERKVQLCITNTINEEIAKSAKIVIAYDVNADIIERLNHLSMEIPKLFLLSKQTNEEARFFYLRRLGKQTVQKLNFNEQPSENNLIEIKDSIIMNNEIDSKNLDKEYSITVEKESNKLNSLSVHKSLYEYGIPYLFSSNEFEINVDENLLLPGFILNDKIFFILVMSETISLFISSEISTYFKSLVEKYHQVHLLLFLNNIKDISFSFRCKLLHEANRFNIWISFLEKDTELSELLTHVCTNKMFKL